MTAFKDIAMGDTFHCPYTDMKYRKTGDYSARCLSDIAHRPGMEFDDFDEDEEVNACSNDSEKP